MMKRVTPGVAVTTALLMSTATAVNAQEGSTLDIGRLALAGYGDVSYTDSDNMNTNVISRFVPIFLFQLSEKIHFEAELEFSIDENGETEVEMEYADMHYFFNDNTTITAGKFLLPFGQFGPNLHPSWINKLPSMPGTYGHHSTSLLSPLLPIISDTGINIRNSFNLGSGKLFTDFYVVSGPRMEVGEHGDEPAPDDHAEEPDDHAEEPDDHAEEPDDHGEEPTDEPEEGHGAFPEVDFTSKRGDNNGKKAFGGRVAYAFLPQWEVGYSFYRGAYDDDGALDFTASAIDFNWTGTYASVRGELINTTTEGLHEDGDIEEFDRNGWYVQGTWQARQLGKEMLTPYELVMRFSQISKNEGGERWTLGVNYWLEASTVLKFAYEDTKLDDGNTDNRLFVQLAFGF